MIYSSGINRNARIAAPLSVAAALFGMTFPLNNFVVLSTKVAI
ncbi:hypothetical protein [Treponema sp. TIM-1]